MMAASGPAELGGIESALEQALARLFALREAYPQLKASDNFVQLQRDLVEVENQLQYARRFYNGAVRDYNDTVQKVPDLLIARTFGFVRGQFYQAADGERLDGEDVFYTAEGETVSADAPDRFEIRFHLHPNVKASRRTDGSSVLLVMPGKETWLFSAPNMEVEVEESVFLSATDGPRRTSQIVIADEVRALPRVVWTFIRANQQPREKERQQAAAEGPKLPL